MAEEERPKRNDGEPKMPHKLFKEKLSKKTTKVGPGSVHSRELNPLLAAGDRSTMEPSPDLTTYGIKLGWVQGVLIPCLLNIWGVMLFLRIAWVVAQAGLGYTIIIITLSSVICIITTLSLSAICTNGKLKGGGVYYIVSRSLGAELGASVGIIFAFANAVAASMNTIGFCESLNEQLKKYGLKIVDNSTNDIRIVGALTLFVMCVICAIGMDWETKTQNLLIVTILVGIFNYIIGTAVGPRSDKARAQGFVGVNLDTARQNWKPDFRLSEGENHNFFSVFAVYFPAVTGVQAGANICGDLRDPASAIPKGTLIALAVSISSYCAMAVLSGMGALRDASGRLEDLHNNTLEACKPKCEYGLHNNYEIMNLMSLWGPLVTTGCWAATLSTALTNLLSVPRLIQALGWDNIYPGLSFFSKPFGRHGEPYRGYVLVFTVSLLFLLIADLNRIAPLITNFYLASYALINFCTFHASFTQHISWRPSFTFYNTWVSLLGFFLCLMMMIIISWYMALATVVIFFALYLVVHYRKPYVSWAGSAQAAKYKDTVTELINMTHTAEEAQIYSPQVLVLSAPFESPSLLDMAQIITDRGSFFIMAHIVEEELTREQRLLDLRLGQQWLLSKKTRGFYVCIDGVEKDKGLRMLLQASGVGKVSPNILMLDFKDGWDRNPLVEIEAYHRLIKLGFAQRVAVCVLRVSRHHWPLPVNVQLASAARPPAAAPAPRPARPLVAPTGPAVYRVMYSDSEEELTADTHHAVEESPPKSSKEPSQSRDEAETNSSKHNNNEFQALSAVFNKKNIDAWWFYFDGGLNILLPYIIVQSNSQGKNLRIFALAKGDEQQKGRENMEELLKKYRINYSELTVFPGLDQNPSKSMWDQFNAIVNNFKTENTSNVLITDTELTNQHIRTRRHLRVKELLVQHSSDADIIVLTLPFPRKGISPCLYMSWLEILSSGLPPLLFVRGNNITVL